MANKEEREARDRQIRTLVVLQTKTLGVPEEAMVEAQIIWVVEVKDHQCKVVEDLWVVQVETGVPLAEEEVEEEEVHSLKEDLLLVRLDPWDQESMVEMVVGGQEQGEEEVQEVGSNNRSQEAEGEIEKQEAHLSQFANCDFHV